MCLASLMVWARAQQCVLYLSILMHFARVRLWTSAGCGRVRRVVSLSAGTVSASQGAQASQGEIIKILLEGGNTVT